MDRSPRFALLALLSAVAAAAPAAGAPEKRDEIPAPDAAAAAWMERTGHPGPYVVIPDPARPRPPFAFSPEDEAMLEEIQLGAFKFFWTDRHVNPATGLVLDRSSADIASVAGVGFQLSAMVVGVERGWITREQGEARARKILSTLLGVPNNRKAGLFYHFLDAGTGGPRRLGSEDVVSTIDSAILFAGALTAGSYFGGEVDELARQMVAAADWSFFTAGDEHDGTPMEGFISLGWRPNDFQNDPTGAGSLLPYFWADADDEQRLVYFISTLAPDEGKRVGPEAYYRLRRKIGAYADTGPMSFSPWSGALFTKFFAHSWIDYAGIGFSIGPDRPDLFNVPHRAPVDWWENSRRAVRLHRLKAIENPEGLPTLGPDAWGLTASDAPAGYRVPGVYPDPLPMGPARPEFDYPTHVPADAYGDGTIAPYGAGSAIIFEPELAVAALRHYRSLKFPNGAPLVWRAPQSGGFGFIDAFNLAGPGGAPWAASDYVAIDQGPLLLAIENARTGLVWRWFHAHPWVMEGMGRLMLCREDDFGRRQREAGTEPPGMPKGARPPAGPAPE